MIVDQYQCLLIIIVEVIVTILDVMHDIKQCCRPVRSPRHEFMPGLLSQLNGLVSSNGSLMPFLLIVFLGE